MRRRAYRQQEGEEEGTSAERSLLGSHIPLAALVQTLAVAEYLNFRRAANVLGVAQSSVSERIKALEETLGVLLFERRHRGVRLTEAGHRFVTEISAGIDYLDRAIRTAGAISSGSEGRLGIGLHTSIASGFLADLRSKYRLAYPKVEQAVTEGRSSETIGMVRDGQLDVAFVLGAAETPDCHSRHFWSEPWVIALPADHPLTTLQSVTWDDLALETFLVRQGGSGPQVFEHIIRRIAEHAKPPHVHRCEVGRDTLMHMVAAHEGITLTTEATTEVPFPGVTFCPIADETEHARFSAVWSPHNRNPALKNLLDLAIKMNRSGRSV